MVSLPLGAGSNLPATYCVTTSPPIPLPLYGASTVNVCGGGAVNAYVRSVPNCLPPPFSPSDREWQRWTNWKEPA